MKINDLPVLIILVGGFLMLCFSTQSQTPFSDEIRKFERTDSAAAPLLQGQILLYGSSTMRLWDSCAVDVTFKNLKVVNRGFGGSICLQANLYFERVVLPHKPEFLFFYEGDNDLWGKRPVDSVFSDFKIFINKVKKQMPDTKLVILSVKQSPSRESVTPEQLIFNKRMRRYVRGIRRVYFLDVATPMLGADGKPRKDLFMPDMLHMNRDGYLIWAAAVQQFLKKFD